jgi:hypothetical protein
MKTTESVSVKVDWAKGTAEIIPHNLTEDDGMLVITTEEDGTVIKELDVFYSREIQKDRMSTNVAEFEYSNSAKIFVRKPNGILSNRYKGEARMTMTDELYIKPIFENGEIVGFNTSDGKEHLTDDLNKEIFDLTDPENPVSFEPKKYEQKVNYADGWLPMFSTFKAQTKIVALTYADAKER